MVFIIEVCIGTAFDCEENEIKEGEKKLLELR